MPKVAVHDLKIQASAKDLIVGTHGRAIYKVGIAKIQELTPDLLAKKIHLFSLTDRTKSERWGTKSYAWEEANVPSQEIWCYAGIAGTAVVSITNDQNREVYQKQIALTTGLNSIPYSYEISKELADKWNKSDKKIGIKEAENKRYYLPAGKYKVTISKSEGSTMTTFAIKPSKINKSE